MKVYLSIKEFAERVGVSVDALKGDRRRGLLPTPDAMIGPYDGWTRATVDRYAKTVTVVRASNDRHLDPARDL